MSYKAGDPSRHLGRNSLLVIRQYITNSLTGQLPAVTQLIIGQRLTTHTTSEASEKRTAQPGSCVTMANGPTMKISTEVPISPPKTPSVRESDAEYVESPTTGRRKRRRIIVPNEELVQRNSDCQNLWDRKMRDFGYTTSFYAKVAVLMISWDAPFDDLKTEGEVGSSMSHPCTQTNLM
jgi:hypothetical protein